MAAIMCVFGLRFAQSVGETSRQPEVGYAQKREDAGDRHPSAVALAAQIADCQRNRDDAYKNGQNTPEERGTGPLKETTRAALAVISRGTSA